MGFSLLCRLGIHDWQTIQVHGDYDMQQCSRCQERRVQPNKPFPAPPSDIVNNWTKK